MKGRGRVGGGGGWAAGGRMTGIGRRGRAQGWGGQRPYIKETMHSALNL